MLAIRYPHTTWRESVNDTQGPDIQALRELYRQLLDAWNARRADDFAALFADDATTIGFDGTVANGPEIGEHLRSVFEDHPTASYIAKVREVRLIDAEFALLRAAVGVIPPGAQELNPAANAHQSVIARRDGDGWKIVLLQNTPAQYHGRPELVEQHTRELSELLVRQER
jgi:uncharacterized protein (TIGR02246 family)